MGPLRLLEDLDLRLGDLTGDIMISKDLPSRMDLLLDGLEFRDSFGDERRSPTDWLFFIDLDLCFGFGTSKSKSESPSEIGITMCFKGNDLSRLLEDLDLCFGDLLGDSMISKDLPSRTDSLE